MKEKRKIPKRLFAFLIHPLLLALMATAVVIFILHLQWDFSKYMIGLKDSGITPGSFIYDDVDNNGYSDHIMAVNNKIGTTGVSIQLFPKNYTEQWNFHGQLNFVTNRNLITGLIPRMQLNMDCFAKKTEEASSKSVLNKLTTNSSLPSKITAREEKNRHRQAPTPQAKDSK